MKAVVLERVEGRTGLTLTDVAEPALGPRQVAVAVRAASVNRADLLQRDGGYLPGETPRMLRAGLDAAGEVVAIGDAVDTVAVGERVMAMAPGGLAERVIVDEAMVVPIPETWSEAEGAAAVVALMTAHQALVSAGRLRHGESVLVHGAASGVGLQTVRLSRFLGAATVIATTRSSRAADLLRALGADHVVDLSRDDFAPAVRRIEGDAGVDVVIDHVGGPYLERTIDCLAVKGRLVSVGRLAGGTGTLDMEILALKRLEIIGLTFRTRDDEEKAAIAAGVRKLLETEGAADALRPTIDRTLPWTRVDAAYDVMERNAHLGKIVLEVVPGS